MAATAQSQTVLPQWARPACPRCGYDQSGLVMTWSASCPMSGTCSECGLEFQWRDVLKPRPFPAWSYEHGRLLSLGRWFRTGARAVCLFPLWRGLRLETAVIPLKLAAMLVLAVVGVAAIAFGGAWLSYGLARVLDISHPLADLLLFLGDWWIAAVWLFDGLREWWWLAVGAAWCLFMPLAYQLLPGTLRRAKVRKVHILRVAAYAVLGALVLVCVRALLVWCVLCFESYMWDSSTWERTTLGVVVEQTIRWRTFGCGLICWFIAFWWVATARYLRLPHAGAVALLMVLLSGVCAGVVGLAFGGGDFAMAVLP